MTETRVTQAEFDRAFNDLNRIPGEIIKLRKQIADLEARRIEAKATVDRARREADQDAD